MKKLRPEVESTIPQQGGLFEVADMHFMGMFNITTDELDYIGEFATDDELGIFVKNRPTFSEKRQALEIRNKYIELYNKSKQNGN